MLDQKWIRLFLWTRWWYSKCTWWCCNTDPIPTLTHNLVNQVHTWSMFDKDNMKLVSYIVKPKSRSEEPTQDNKQKQRRNWILLQGNKTRNTSLSWGLLNTTARAHFWTFFVQVAERWAIVTIHGRGKTGQPTHPRHTNQVMYRNKHETACRASFHVHVFISQFISSTDLVHCQQISSIV